MPVLPPGYQLLNIGGPGAVFGPGGVQVGLIQTGFGGNTLWAFNGVPDIDPWTIYPAIVADLVAEAQAIIKAVQVVGTGVGTMGAELAARLTTIQTAIGGLPQQLAAAMAKAGAGPPAEILARLAQVEQEQQGFFAELATALNAGFAAVATTQQQDFAALAGVVEEIRAAQVERPAATLEELREALTEKLDAVTSAVDRAIAGASAADAPSLNDIASAVKGLHAALILNVSTPLRDISDSVYLGTSALDHDLTRALNTIAGLLFQAVQQQAQEEPADFATPVKSLTATLDDKLEKNWQRQQAIARQLGFETDESGDVPIAGAGFALGPIIALVKPWLSKLFWASVLVKEVTGFDSLQTAREMLPFLEGSVAGYAREVGGIAVRSIEAVHRPMQSVMRAGTELFFHEIEQRLVGFGEATPDNVLQVGTELLALAGGLGLSAHAVAVAAEKASVAKHLGFPQLAAFLADLADFSHITRSTFGEQIDAALKPAARRGALARFRPELPPGFLADQMYLERLMSDGDFSQYLAEHGWSDEWIQRHLLEIWREPSPREMAMVFEDGEIDAEWGMKMLQQSGFEDEDAARLLKGVVTRAQKTVRSNLLGAVLTNYEDGIYDEGRAAAILRSLPLSDESVQLFLEVGQHKRLNAELEAHRKLLEDATVAGAIDDADLSASLAALGYDARAQSQAGARARLRLGVRLFRDEQADVKAAVRRAQTDSLNAGMEWFRRDLLDAGGLAAHLTASGVNESEVRALVELAQARRAPVPKLPEILTLERQAQEEQKLGQRAILELQQQKVIDERASASLQAGLGVPSREAALEARIVAAKLARPPDVAKPPTLTEVENETRSAKTDQAIELFRQGALSEGSLNAQLVAAGHPPKLATAIAAKAAARKRTEVVRAILEHNAQELERQRDELEKAAVFAYRGRRHDADELLQNLLGIGRPLGTAQAIVIREEARRKLEEDRQAAHLAAGGKGAVSRVSA